MLYEAYVDGGARGQGVDGSKLGEGACAVVIYKNRKLYTQFCRGLGRRSNNECEYEAVICAMLMGWTMELPDLIIYSDSQLVCNQVNKQWDCKENLASLLLSVREIEEVYRSRLVWVRRQEVWEADGLVNLFLDKLLGQENIHG